MAVSLVTTTLDAAVAPNVTVAPASNAIPASVTAVPPAGGPEAGLTEKRIRCENSEVLPSGEVAVAVIGWPSSSATENMTLYVAVPVASVMTCIDPMYVSPSRKSCGRRWQMGFA